MGDPTNGGLHPATSDATGHGVFWVRVLEDDHEKRAEACRVLLGAVRPLAAVGEMDLPVATSHRWPEPVRVAASRLRDLGVPPSKHNDKYMQTELVPLTDERVWQDFVAVAPYAYYAEVWDAENAPAKWTGGNPVNELASVDDSGTGVFLAISPEEARQLGDQLGGRVEIAPTFREPVPVPLSVRWREWLSRWRK